MRLVRCWRHQKMTYLVLLSMYILVTSKEHVPVVTYGALLGGGVGRRSSFYSTVEQVVLCTFSKWFWS